MPNLNRQRGAMARALARLVSLSPQGDHVTFDRADVGKTGLPCEPLPT